MSPHPLRTVPLIFTILALLWILGGDCGADPAEIAAEGYIAGISSYLEDFRKIPGVTPEEIAAIEAIQAEGHALHFATFRSGEAIVNRRGRKGGFLINFATALSNMLGIEITHEYVGRRVMTERLQSGYVDLSCEVPYTEADRQSLIMTTPIFERRIKAYALKERPVDAASEEARTYGAGAAHGDPFRYGFLEGTGVASLVLADTTRVVEAVNAANYREAVEMLQDGRIDVFFDEAPADQYFGVFPEIKSSNYFPPINTPLSLATGRQELGAIISVVQKFLDAGGRDWLFELFSNSAEENRRIYFEDSLDRDQEILLARLRARLTPVRVAAGSFDYPATFWNDRDNAFEGIAHDALAEITKVTGVDFMVVNPPKAPDEGLEELLLSGAADMMVNFNYFGQDADNFPLSAIPHNYDRYALITKLEHPDIKFSQIAYETVGLVMGNKFSDVYMRWFPHANNFRTYLAMPMAVEGLRRGEVDCLMASSNYLLNLTNYLEDPLFKAGLVFDEDVPFGFAFDPNQEDLRNLIDKALVFVELDRIQAGWNSRMFDYRHKFIKDASPWLVVFCAVLIITLTGLIRVNSRNRRLNQNLESMVSARTDQLLAAQEDLEREKLLMSSIVETCPVSLLITRGGRVLFLNPCAKRFLGKKAGSDWSDSFADEGVLAEYRNVLAEGGAVDWRPTKLRRADGKVREALLYTFISEYYGENAFMSWITDVTELKENARALGLARDIAEDSARAKSEFLANMSHEIRTPMNAILGLTQLALQTELSDTQRDYLEKTAAATKSLLGIINDILDFSKIEAGKLEMERINFQLEDVLDGVLNLFSFRAADKGLELLLKVEPHVRTALVGDPLRLGQVLNNLMGNAIKFTEKGSVLLSVETLYISKSDITLLFKVEDTGIGLSREQMDCLFTAFNQADNSFTRRYGGTGLGLSISKRVVELMHGDVKVDGELGKGSIFSFTARFGLSGNDAVYLPKQEYLSGASAICVDDYPAALGVMAGYLETLGFKVAKALSADEALEKMKAAAELGRPFELAVIDTLGGEAGAKGLADSVKDSLSPGARPKMILAAAQGDQAAAAAMSLGFSAVVAKPVTAAGLTEALGEALKGDEKSKRRRSRVVIGDAAASVAHLKGARILLAEDNEVNQLVASRLLRNADLHVDVANNGREAVDLVQSRSYDLVLMDIQMPVMDGFSATMAIRSLPGGDSLPIVAMTAHAMSGDREQSLAVGMNDHITKPINLTELFGVLNRWIVKAERPAAGDIGEPASLIVNDPRN